MRILFLANYYPPYELGGQERSCQQVVQGLQARGHETLVLTSMHGTGNRPLRETDVYRGLYLEMDMAPLRHSLIFFTRRKAREQHNLRLLEQTIREFRPDVVFVWGMWNLSRTLPALAEALLPGRVAYRFASYWPTLPSQHQLYWQAPGRSLPARLLKGILAPLALAQLRREPPPPALRFDHAVCVSAATRTLLLEAGLPLAHARVIHTGLDVARYGQNGRAAPRRATDESLKLLYAGRLSADKGLETAITALAELAQRGRAAGTTLTIAGSGDAAYVASLRRLAETAGVSERVTFLGRVPHEEMPALMQAAGVLLVPSTWAEPFARVVLEGMAAGTPVVASDIGGAGEIVQDGVNGLLFPAGDSRALAERIARLAADPALCAALGEAGRQTVSRHFTAAAMLDAYEEFLQEAAGAPGLEIGSSGDWETAGRPVTQLPMQL